MDRDLVDVAERTEVESNARINLADNFMALGLLDDADAQYRIVEAFVRDPDPNAILDMWRYSQHLFASFAELALWRGRPDAALRYAQKCYDLAAPASHPKNVVKAKRLRGETFVCLRRPEDAEVEVDEALPIARTLGNRPQLWKTLDARGSLEVARGRPEVAAEFFTEAFELRRATAERIGDCRLGRRFANSLA